MREIPPLFGAVVLSILLVLVPVAASHPVPVDYPQLEPNDRPSAAVDISPRWLDGLRDDTDGPKIGEPYKILGVTVRKDKDYYAVDLGKGDALHVTLVYEKSTRDLSTAIFDPSMSKLTASGSKGVNVNRQNNRIHEELSITAQQTGTYYIKVSGEPRRDVHYRLEIDDRYEENDKRETAQPLHPSYITCLSSGPQISRYSTTYSDLLVSTFERDYYVLDLDEGDTLNVTFSYTATKHVGQTDPARIDPQSSDDEDETDEGHRDYSLKPFKMILIPQRESLEADTMLVNPFVQESGSTIDYQVRSSGKHYLLVQRRTNRAQKTGVSAQYSMDIHHNPSGSGLNCVAPGVEGQINGILDQSSNIPGIGWVLGSGEALVTVEGPENVHFLVDLEGGTVSDFERIRDPGSRAVTYRVSVSNQTLHNISEADDQSRAFERAYRSGRIEVTPVGTYNKIKFGIVDTAYRLWNITGRL